MLEIKKGNMKKYTPKLKIYVEDTIFKENTNY